MLTSFNFTMSNNAPDAGIFASDNVKSSIVLSGFELPEYAHISPIMKMEISVDEDGNENQHKRKLSKRKDPEAAVGFYQEQGYPSESVLEYLLTIANSNY